MNITISLNEFLLILGAVVAVSFFIGHGFDRTFGGEKDNDISDPRYPPGININWTVPSADASTEPVGDDLEKSIEEKRLYLTGWSGFTPQSFKDTFERTCGYSLPGEATSSEVNERRLARDVNRTLGYMKTEYDIALLSPTGANVLPDEFIGAVKQRPGHRVGYSLSISLGDGSAEINGKPVSLDDAIKFKSGDFTDEWIKGICSGGEVVDDEQI